MTRRPRMLIAVSEKGGVGKTTFVRGVVDIARARDLRTGAFDGDAGVGQLLRHHGTKTDGQTDVSQDPLVGVGYFDIRDTNAREALNTIEAKGADLVVLDLPGGTRKAFETLLPGGFRSFVDMYADEGFDPLVLLVITPVKSCALEVVRMIEHLGGAERLVVVMNGSGFGAGSFYQYAGGPDHPKYGIARERLLASGGREMIMPTIRPLTYLYLDEFSMTMGEALRMDDPEYRGHRKWIREVMDELASELEHVGVLPRVSVKS